MDECGVAVNVSADSQEREDTSEQLPPLCFKLRAEKSTGGEVTLLEWSPIMDIVALAFSDNSVVLNRLSWQKVWSIPPIKSPPTAMAWRPDGRVLAISCKDGSVGLYNVENGHLLNDFSAGVAITSLYWTKLEKDEDESLDDTCSLNQGWYPLLPPLPSMDSRGRHFSPRPETATAYRHPKDGHVHICVSGIFLVATLESSQPREGSQVILCKISCDFKDVCSLILTCKNTAGTTGLTMEAYETSLLSERSSELQHMILEFGHVICHLEYLNSILTAMFEAWDDLLFTLDNQLASFAKTLPDGRTVADEFLVLLACGSASLALQEFLTLKLTAKGVKKLGLSLEHSYVNIKKFLLHHFQVGLQGTLLHLGELLDMTHCRERFGPLGLSDKMVQTCINLAGTLGLKSQEMMLAIDHSLRSVKVFFMWLYVVILKLSNELIPKGLKDDLTPGELKLIMDFLRRRMTKAKSGNHAFNLETVGQYLSNSDLKYIEEKPEGFWETFVMNYHQTSSSTSSTPCLFKPSPTKSLFQLYRNLRQVVDDTFTKPMLSIEQSFSSTLHRDLDKQLGEITANKLESLLCYFTHEEKSGFCIPATTVQMSDNAGFSCCSEVELICYSTRGKDKKIEKCTFCVRNVEALAEKEDHVRCLILSIRAYDESNFTVLVQYSFKVLEETSPGDGTNPTRLVAVTHSVIAQLPIAGIVSLAKDSGSSDVQDVGPMLTQVHVLGPFKAGRLAVVGGTRKLAAVRGWSAAAMSRAAPVCVRLAVERYLVEQSVSCRDVQELLLASVSQSGKKIRLFDVEEEEEDQNGTSFSKGQISTI